MTQTEHMNAVLGNKVKEINKLKEINTEFLEALKAFVNMNPINEKEMFITVTNAKLAIAKAEGK